MYSREQEIVIEKFRCGENIFITGPGGTGKTFLIKHLVEIFNKESIAPFVELGDETTTNTINNRKKPYNKSSEIQVCALTGCAAILLDCNATTLHSFSGIGLANNSADVVVDRVCNNRAKKAKWKRVKCLIIDEVSMLSLKIFNILDSIGRKAKSRPNIPFGGIQIVCSGDFFQLPPVGDDNEPETTQFCFESPSWNLTFPPESNQVVLRTIYRQQDDKYINLLNRIRIGKISKKDIACLEECLTANKANSNDDVLTKILPRRADVEFINRREYNKLNPENEKVYRTLRIDVELEAKLESKPESLKNIDTKSVERDTDMEIEYEYLTKNILPAQELRLRIGAMVMCIINLDMEKGIVNGSQGRVIGFSESMSPIIKFNNGVIMPINPHTWTSEKISSVGVKQIPLIYAWAITIHKSQGLSLDSALIDIGTQIFEYGQTYVALSRIRSLDGVYLQSFNYRKIKVNPTVKRFYDMLDSIDN